MNTEPVIAMVTAIIVAACALLIAFGVSLTDEQITAMVGFAVAIIGLGIYVRDRVTPVGRK